MITAWAVVLLTVEVHFVDVTQRKAARIDLTGRQRNGDRLPRPAVNGPVEGAKNSPFPKGA